VVDSCGTGAWHVGEGADPRTVAVARKYGLATDHAARQVAVPTDFERFHWLVAMDHANKRSLLSLGAPPERVRLLRTFDPGLGRSDDAGLAVPDPYYGGEEGFEAMYRMIRSSSEGLLDHLLREPQPGR
jgi:protein-tyrosine phosphatase